MKIAMVSQVYPPIISGASVIVHNLSTEMADRGHDVLVVSSSDEGPAYSRYQGRMALVRVRSQPNPVRTGTRLALFATKSVEEALEAFRPDVLHLHDPSGMGIWALRYAKEHGIPALYSCHALPPLLSAYAGGGEMVKSVVEFALWRYGDWFISQCDLTICPTQTIVDILMAQIGCRAEVISGGVNTKMFSPVPRSSFERAHILEKYGIRQDLPVILHAGRLDIEKKSHLVLEAAAAAMREVEGQVVIIGDGTERNALEEQAHELGLNGRVVFTGFVERTGDLPALYRIGSVFVSACDIETQGLVLLEALASGVPAVAVRAGGIPDVIRHGVNGFLAAPDSVRELATGLVAVLSNPSAAVRLSGNARDLMEAHSLDTTFDLYEAAYKRLRGSGDVGSREEHMFYGEKAAQADRSTR